MTEKTSQQPEKEQRKSFFLLDRFYKHPKIIVGVILIITVFFAVQLPRMQIDNNNFRFIPETDSSRQFSVKVAETFGDEVMVLIGIKRDFSSIVDSEFIKSLQSFTQKLETISLVREVQSIVTTTHLEGQDDALVSSPLVPKDFSGTRSELAAIRYKLREWDMYKRSLVSDDLQSTQIVVYLNTREIDSGSPAVGTACTEILALADSWEHRDATMYVTGLPVFNQMVNEATSHDLLFLVPLVVLVVIGVLFFSFRRIAGVLLPLLTVGVSTIWAIGAMPLFGIKLSILATVLPVILVAVGSAYGIHVVSHYFDHVDQTGSLSVQVYNAQILWAVKRVIRPVFLAALTTFAGFVSFCFTPAVPIAEFGMFASFGVLVAFGVSVTLIPALLILRGPRKSNKKKHSIHETHRVDQFIVNTFMLIVKHKRIITTFFILVLVFSGAGVSKLIIDNVLMEYFQKDNRVVQSDGFIKKEFGGSKLLTVVVSAEDGKVLHPEVLGAMAELSDFLQEDVPEVGKVTSLVDLIKRINQVFHVDEKTVPPHAIKEPQAAVPVASQDIETSEEDSFGNFGSFEEETADDALDGFGDFGLDSEDLQMSSPTSVAATPYDEYRAEDFILLLDEILFEHNREKMSAADVLIALEKKLNKRGSRFYEIPLIPEKYGKTTQDELQGLIENYLILLSGNSDGFIDNTYSPTQLKMNIQLRTNGQTDTDEVIKKIERFIAARFPSYADVEMGGPVLIEKSLNLLVVRSQLISVAVSLVFVFLILTVYYRSGFAGLLGVIPLAVSIFVNFGIMGFAGIKLNIGTAMVASFSIGIGIDYTIHYLSAYHHACIDGKNGDLLLSDTFFDSGKPILFNAVSVGAGFAVLMLSGFNMLADLGFLIAVSMAVSSFAALTLLPTILQIMKPRFIKKVLPVDISLKRANMNDIDA